MPSSMFLPAATPEKDGNSTTEELGKQPGECGSVWSHQSPSCCHLAGDCVLGHLMGNLHIPSYVLRTTVGQHTAEQSSLTCTTNSAPCVSAGGQSSAVQS